MVHCRCYAQRAIREGGTYQIMGKWWWVQHPYPQVGVSKVAQGQRILYPCHACGVLFLRLGAWNGRPQVYCTDACRRRAAHEVDHAIRRRPEQRAWKAIKQRLDHRPTKPEMERWAGILAARWAYYGGMCWMCGAPAEGWDHVKPLARGGHPTHGANLRPACTPCNSSKGAAWSSAA
jgi:5-methylcytosine-specific restriction endonuclease McrA